MDQVLQSPELLTMIFGIIRQDEEKSKARFTSRIGHPNRKFSLASLARVNSTWRDLALSILWASPDVEALANIRSKRRQQYASYIRVLDFSGPQTRKDPTLHTLFANIQFQRIKKLVLGHNLTSDSDCGELDPMKFRPLAIHKDWSISTSQYFQETLEDLELLSWDSIFFSAIGTQLRPDDLLEFFRASGHLESIQLRLGPNSKSRLITGDLLLQFSKVTKLKHLVIDNKLDQPDLFWAIKKQNINPFQKLKSVEMTAKSTVVSAAVHVLPNVETLRLNISDGSCFKDLSAMPSLRDLWIFVTPTATFTREQLLSLRALHKLESLCMRKGDGELDELKASDLTNDDFDDMASGWPELKDFTFEVWWQTRSFQTFSSLSKHCPNLEHLQLAGTYDLQALSDISKVMFPKLRSIYLQEGDLGEAPIRLTPLQIARLLDYHAPVLESLGFWTEDEDEDGGLIVRAWDKFRACLVNTVISQY